MWYIYMKLNIRIYVSNENERFYKIIFFQFEYVHITSTFFDLSLMIGPYAVNIV